MASGMYPGYYPCSIILALLVALPAGAAGDVTLQVPASATIGAPLEVHWQGGSSPQDFITIVPPGTAEGRYDAYQYARQNPVTLTVPAMPGEYEVRYLGAASYPTLARVPLEVIDTVATLAAPATVTAGAEFSIEWSGPDNPRDFITVVAAGTPESQYDAYAYTDKGSPLTLRAPDKAGDYELRYLMGSGSYRTLGRASLTVSGTDASVSAPQSVAAGSAFEIAWQGPDNTQDFITIVPASAAAREYDAHVYTSRGNPSVLNAPEVPGTYEVRYLTGQTYATLASAALTVTPVSATLTAPPSAPARDAVAVSWEGPGNPTDYVLLLPVGSDNQASGNYAMVARGKTLKIATPAEPGEYELRYVTSGQRLTLGKRPITIVPRPAPGELQVMDATASGPELAGATVAVVLDASGSMLQRLDGERRIDLAKAAVTELVEDALPDSVSFALRVFGHKEADSCRSDLEIPPGALDRAAAAAEVASIEAMNLARTPIAESLRLVAADVGERSGPLLIILVTDGEETCDGDPAAVIRELAANGAEVRVNVVGFAIDELMLQETFAEWARLGNGKYFNASDGAELAASLRQSVEVPFSVLNAAGKVVATGTVNGPTVAVDAGTYRVVVRSAAGRTVDGIVVRMEDVTRVDVGSARSPETTL
ncbi:MAG: VWA domain-containing protein [Woeseia sp.]